MDNWKLESNRGCLIKGSLLTKSSSFSSKKHSSCRLILIKKFKPPRCLLKKQHNKPYTVQENPGVIKGNFLVQVLGIHSPLIYAVQ